MIARSLLSRLFVGLALATLAAPALAASPEDEAKMVQFNNRFGNQTGPTSIGTVTFTMLEAGQRFMYGIQTPFESGLSGYKTTLEVEFPASVVPDVAVYPAEVVQVVGNKVIVTRDPGGGIGIRIPFDVKDEEDLPADATEVRMKTKITVVTENSGTLMGSIENAVPLDRPATFTASVAASPNEIRVDDSGLITLTVTFENGSDKPLQHVAPFGDPTPSTADAVEYVSGPTPPSVGLVGRGNTGSLTYTYRPKKVGSVTFAFEEFLAESPDGVVATGGATSNAVKIKGDVVVDVTVEPRPLATNSSTVSTGTIRVKVTEPDGEPVEGQTVALGFPQYFGIVDLNPRLLVCKPDGTLVFPPGTNPTLNDVDYAVTPASGEVTYQLHLGTQRRTPQLFVSAAAIDENKLELGDDGLTIDLTGDDAAPSPTLNQTLDEEQRKDLPASEQAAEHATAVPRGTPFEVLDALVGWLELKREAGVLTSFDWVPISTVNEQHAGVLVYPRAQLDAVIKHFETGAEVPGAVVIQIEKSELGDSRHEVKWLRTLMPLDTWEQIPLDEHGLPRPGTGADLRLTAKPAIAHVTSGSYAFLGYPYPAVDGPAATGYGGPCLPKLDRLSVRTYSPVTLLVRDASGRVLGVDADGVYHNDIPGAVFSSGEPAQHLLPPGAYDVEITGTGKGPATIVLSAPGMTPRTIAFTAKPGKTGTLAFDGTLANTTAKFGKKRIKVADGVPITVTGVKRKVKLRTGDPIALTVTNFAGTPVAGARVHAVGKGVDAETVTGIDGTVSLPLAVTKATKKLTVTIDGAGVQPTTLKLRVKLLKS